MRDPENHPPLHNSVQGAPVFSDLSPPELLRNFVPGRSVSIGGVPNGALPVVARWD
jgi:hypothetical protein